MVKRLRVTRVEPGSLADNVGIKAGDSLDTANDSPVVDMESLNAAFASNSRGPWSATPRPVRVHFLRGDSDGNVSLAHAIHGIEGVAAEYSAEQIVNRRREQQEQQAAQAAAMGREIESHLGGTLESLFRRHTGSVVSINIATPLKNVDCVLASVSADHLTALFDDAYVIIPFNSVIQASLDRKFQRLSICVRHQIIYKGSVGFGMSLPLGDL